LSSTESSSSDEEADDEESEEESEEEDDKVEEEPVRRVQLHDPASQKPPDSKDKRSIDVSDL